MKEQNVHKLEARLKKDLKKENITAKELEQMKFDKQNIDETKFTKSQKKIFYRMLKMHAPMYKELTRIKTVSKYMKNKKLKKIIDEYNQNAKQINNAAGFLGILKEFKVDMIPDDFLENKGKSTIFSVVDKQNELEALDLATPKEVFENEESDDFLDLDKIVDSTINKTIDIDGSNKNNANNSDEIAETEFEKKDTTEIIGDDTVIISENDSEDSIDKIQKETEELLDATKKLTQNDNDIEGNISNNQQNSNEDENNINDNQQNDNENILQSHETKELKQFEEVDSIDDEFEDEHADFTNYFTDAKNTMVINEDVNDKLNFEQNDDNDDVKEVIEDYAINKENRFIQGTEKYFDNDENNLTYDIEVEKFNSKFDEFSDNFELKEVYVSKEDEFDNEILSNNNPRNDFYDQNYFIDDEYTAPMFEDQSIINEVKQLHNDINQQKTNNSENNEILNEIHQLSHQLNRLTKDFEDLKKSNNSNDINGLSSYNQAKDHLDIDNFSLVEKNVNVTELKNEFKLIMNRLDELSSYVSDYKIPLKPADDKEKGIYESLIERYFYNKK